MAKKMKITEQTIFDALPCQSEIKSYLNVKKRLKHLHQNLVRRGHLEVAKHVLELYIKRLVKLPYTTVGIQTTEILKRQKFEPVYTDNGVYFSFMLLNMPKIKIKGTNGQNADIKADIFIYLKLQKQSESLKHQTNELREKTRQIKQRLSESLKDYPKQFFVEKNGKIYVIINDKNNFRVIEPQKLK